MTLRSVVSFIILSLATRAWAAPSPGPAENFTVDVPTKVPGATLQPGPYSISLVNHLSDRDILRVDSVNGNTHVTFIGIPNKTIPKPAAPQVVQWSNQAEGTAYVRGWYFPHSSAVTEFVYPKAEAVAIAKANQAKVPAIDPASEGRVDDPALSKDDMRLVTLWLLSSISVGPSEGSPEIKAERYQQASSTAPPKPGIKQFPHTASYMPLVWIAGFASLFLAALLRLTRYRARTSLPIRLKRV